MSTSAYRFVFDPSVPFHEAEGTLHLAAVAAEGVFGGASVRMDMTYAADERTRSLVLDTSTGVGSALVRIFIALLTREFGDQSFTVRASEKSVVEVAGAGVP